MEPCARGHACDVSMEDGDNTCIVEPSNYESKRKNFHAIIQTLKEEITSLTDALKLIEKERFDFTLRIFKLQLRVHFLRSELDRVGSHKGNKVTSNVIHNGVVQMMERKELLVKLELELESTRSSIAELTKTIISGCKEKGKLSRKLNQKQQLLWEQEQRLHIFDKMGQNLRKNEKVWDAPRNLGLIKCCIHEWHHYASIRARFRQVAQKLLTEEKWYLRRGFKALKQWQCSNIGALTPTHEPLSKGEMLLNHVAHRRFNLAVETSETLQDITLMKKDLFEALRVDLGNFDVDTWLLEQDIGWLSDLPQAISASVIQGDDMLRTHHYAESLNFYEIAFASLATDTSVEPESVKDIYQAYIYGRIGNAHAKLELWSTAAMYHERQYTIASEFGNKQCQIKASLSLGMDYLNEVDYVSAKEYFNEALQLSISLKDDFFQVASHRALQKFCEKMHATDAAVAHGKAIQAIVYNRRDAISTMVEFSIELQARLMKAHAKERYTIKLEHSTRTYFALRKRRGLLQRSISDAQTEKEKLNEAIHKIRYAMGTIDEELRKHCDNGCYRTHSGIHRGVCQLIDSNVIYKSLTEQAQRHKDTITELVKKEKSKEVEIKNMLDELDSLLKDISIEEGPLMSKVMSPGDVFRCIQFNAANITLNDLDCSHDTSSIPFIAASKGKNIYLHDLRSGILTAVFNGDDSELCIREPVRLRSVVTCLFFQGMRIYAGSMDCLIICWDIETEKQIFVAQGHEGSVTCLCIDHEKMISGSADSTLILWNKDTGAMYRKIFGHLRGVLSIECGISWCVSGGSDGFIFVWKCRSCSEDPCYVEFKCKTHLRCDSSCITVVRYGTLQIVSGNNLGRVVLWWLGTGEVIQSCLAHHGPVTSLQFDATRIVSSGTDGNVCVIDIFTGSILATLSSDESTNIRVEAIAFDSYGISSAYVDGTIRRFQWVTSPHDLESYSEQGDSCLCTMQDTFASFSNRHDSPMDSVSIHNHNINTGMLQTSSFPVQESNAEVVEVELHEVQEKTPNTPGGLAYRLLLHAQSGNKTNTIK